MNRAWCYFYTCLLALCNVYPLFAQKTIKLSHNAEIEILTGFTYLADTAKTLQVQNLLPVNEKNKFKQANSEPFKEGFNVYWLHFYLQNNTPFDREYILDFQNWSYVDLYKIKSGQVTGVNKTGHLYPYQKRSYPVANKAYILLPIRAGEVTECLVRLESKFNNELIPSNLRFRVSPRHLVDAETSRTGIVIYAFMAVFVFIFLYTLFIFFFTRLKVYALYLLVIFFALYHTGYNSGHLIALFSTVGITPIFITYFEVIASNLYVITFLLFIDEFFKIKERYPFWHKVIKVLNVIYIIIGVICFIHYPTGIILFILFGLAVIATILSVTLKNVKDNFPASKYLLAGYLALCTWTLIAMLSIARIIPRNDWTFTYSLPIGSLTEVIFFSIALAYRLKLLSQENENIKLFYQQEIFKAQLEIQEQTFQNISSEIHDNIGQVLGLIRLNIYKIEKLAPQAPKEIFNEPKKLIDKVINDLRDLSKTLNTDYIGQIGLTKAVAQQLQILENTQVYTTQLTINNAVVKYEAQRELIVFRVVQELLNNIVKHAQATTIQVSFNYEPDKLIIAVQDNGQGFDSQVMQETGSQGQGLRNIFRRISLINGLIQFDSEPDIGTRVTILLHQSGKATLPTFIGPT